MNKKKPAGLCCYMARLRAGICFAVLLFAFPLLAVASDMPGEGPIDDEYAYYSDNVVTLEPSPGVISSDEGGNLQADKLNALVSKHNICRWLDNLNSSNSYFVPLRTEHEWETFLDNHPSDIVVAPCCVPVDVTLTPSVGVDSFTKTLPYGREDNPTILGTRVVSATFTVPGGTQEVSQVWRCTGGTWQGGPIDRVDHPTCGQTTETNTTGCAAGFDGGITYQRTINVGNVCGVNSAWAEISNTCTASVCSDYTETTSTGCGAGFDGSRTYQRTVNSCTGPVTGWSEVSNSCTPSGGGCSDYSETSSGDCGAGYTGSITYSRTCNTCGGCGGWGTVASSCTAIPTCTESTETTSGECGGGMTGSRTLQRTVNAGGVCGSNTGWSEVSNTCTAACVPEMTIVAAAVVPFLGPSWSCAPMDGCGGAITPGVMCPISLYWCTKSC